MSNPTFRSGPISFSAAENLKKFRLVTVDGDGAHLAAADGAVFGAVVTDSDVPSEPTANSLRIGNPPNAAVFIGPATVPLEVDGDAASVTAGTPLFAGKDGKAATSGSVFIGVAARDGEGDLVKTTLVTPAIAGAADGGSDDGNGGAEGE